MEVHAHNKMLRSSDFSRFIATAPYVCGKNIAQTICQNTFCSSSTCFSSTSLWVYNLKHLFLPHSTFQSGMFTSTILLHGSQHQSDVILNVSLSPGLQRCKVKVWAWEPLGSVLHVNSSSEPILLTQVGPGPYMDMWASVFPAHFTGWIVCNIVSAAPMFSGFGTVGVAGIGIWSACVGDIID